MEADVLSLNVCIVAGTVYRGPEWRPLPSGGSVTSFEIKAKAEGSQTKPDIVRVSWLDAPASALDIQEGSDVLVCGRIRSYWAGRRIVDMSCESVVPLRSTAKVRKRLTSVMAAIQQACP